MQSREMRDAGMRECRPPDTRLQVHGSRVGLDALVNARMPSGANVPASDFAEGAAESSTFPHFVRRRASSRAGEPFGGVIVAFVKEDAYKRFDDLQQRAAELGRYL